MNALELHKNTPKVVGFFNTTPVHISHMVVFLFYPNGLCWVNLVFFYMWLRLSILEVLCCHLLVTTEMVGAVGTDDVSSFRRHLVLDFVFARE